MKQNQHLLITALALVLLALMIKNPEVFHEKTKKISSCITFTDRTNCSSWQMEYQINDIQEHYKR